MISKLSMRILIAGLDDWMPLAAVIGLAREHGMIQGSDATEASIASLRELTVRHLIELGNVSDGGFFVHEKSSDDVLSSLANDIRVSDARQWEFSYWVQNTSDGDALARARDLGNDEKR